MTTLRQKKNPAAPSPEGATGFSRSSRSAPHPGAFLEARFLQPLCISQSQLALELGVSRRRVNELIVGKRSITPDTAVRLAKFFHTDPEFWLLLQMRWDLCQFLEAQKNGSAAK
jgi:addiction module HigA family antidote